MSSPNTKVEVTINGDGVTESQVDKKISKKNVDQPKNKFTCKQKIALLTLCTADFMCFCSMSIMAPFYPREASVKGMTETVAGFVFSFYALVIFLSSPLFGKIIPKIGVKTCFTTGIVVSGACNILFGTLNYIDDYYWFTILSFVIRGAEALGSSAYSTASYVLVTNIFPDHAGSVRGVLEVFVGLGLSAGPAFGGLLFAVGGFELPFYVIGVFIILLAPFNKCLIHENDFKDEKKCGSLRKMLAIPSVIMTAVIIVVISLTWSFLDPTLEPHLRKYDLSPTNIGLIFLLLSAMYGIFSPISGWLSDKMNKYWMLMVIGMFFSGLSLLFLGPSPVIFFIKDSIWCDIAALSVLGVFVAIGLLPTYRSVLDSAILHGGFEDNLGTQGLVAGLWSSVYSLGEVIGPVSGGALFTYWGFPVTVTVMALTNIITAIVAFIYFSYIREKVEETGAAEEKVPEKKETYISAESEFGVVTISGLVPKDVETNASINSNKL